MMVVPTKNQLHRVVLEIAADTAEPLSRRDVVELLRTRLSLNEDDMAEQSSSGVFRVADRTDWAMFDLRRAGYLYRPTRGRFLITPEGRAILQKHHREITDADLRPLIQAGHLDKGTAEEEASCPNEAEQTSGATPDEQMDLAFNQSRDKLVDDLLSRISNESYRDFEVLVLDLLKKMGYGKPAHRPQPRRRHRRHHQSGRIGIGKSVRPGQTLVEPSRRAGDSQFLRQFGSSWRDERRIYHHIDIQQHSPPNCTNHLGWQ